MKLIKKDLLSKFSQYFLTPFGLVITYSFFIGELSLKANDQFKLKEFEMSNTTKTDVDGTTSIPTNPFELVEMLRRANSMNNATEPSDAIDDAIKSFDMIKENKSL